MTLKGIYCAAYTAFDTDGAVDGPLSAAHARRLIDAGCHGVALLGSTGEANSLSSQERMALLEAVIAAGVPARQVLPGTGLCSVPETVALTRHALSCGVDTVVLAPPFYYPAPGSEGLLAYYSRVIDQIGDSRLRILLYHIPQMTDAPIEADLIHALRQRFPGMIVGIKDSGRELPRMESLVQEFPGFSVFAGADPLVGPLLRAGGAGGITATANIIAPMLVELFRRITSGEGADETQKLEKRIAGLRGLFQRWPQIPALKTGQALLSGEPGWSRVRPPLLPLNNEDVAALENAMRDAGLKRIDMEVEA